jgi:hypothetical protein
MVDRSLSNTATEAANDSETGEVFLVLLTLSHASLGSSIRVVNNDTDITSGGNLFTAFPFEITLPNDEENRVPQAKLRIDNVDRQIVQAIRAVGTDPMDVSLQVILASSPNTLEMEYDGMQLKQVRYNADIVEGTLTIEGFLREPYPAGIFNPSFFSAI